MGDEFACHTLTHPALKSTLAKSVVVKEIVGSRNYLLKTCKLPAASVTGFRAPYLTTNPRVRQVGFLVNKLNLRSPCVSVNAHHILIVASSQFNSIIYNSVLFH